MLVICVVFVEQSKGKFIIFWLHKTIMYVCALVTLVLEESILLVTLVHVVINIYDKSNVL